ncbi:MAG: ATP-binding cassette domain-containing protein [Trueperaceae bacterium]|nr:ATP-binding cassette domain-containing protein [Trueperaceae bacterium]
MGYLECHKLGKAYDGTRALQDVSLRVGRGRVHAVIGENGAGKSTLAKVIAGLVPFDSGTLTLAGRPYRPASPRQAAAAGVGMVHQQPMLFSSLSVAENVVLGKEPGRLTVDRALARSEVETVARRYGTFIDPRAKVADLSVGERQRVEILRALYLGADLLIFDEPTAALAPQEVAEFLAGVRRLAAEGRTVVLIAHKLDEVLAVADDVTVLRAGRNVFSGPASAVSESELVGLMVGGVAVGAAAATGARAAPPGPVAAAAEGDPYGSPGAVSLAVVGLSVVSVAGRAALRDVSFTVRAGEVVGVAGVEGGGQEELELALCGLLEPRSGTVELAGHDVTLADPRERRRRGLAAVPSDRLAWACAPAASVFDNGVSQLQYQSPFGFLRPALLERSVRRLLAEFDVRTPGLSVPLAALSGGNVQKLVLGRELTARRRARSEDLGSGATPGAQPSVARHADPSGQGVPVALVLGSPTRGLDVRGIRYLHALVRRYRDAGCAVLLLSTDLDEVIALSDRIVVLAGGAVVATLPGAGATGKEALGRHMLTGVSATS